MQPPPKKIPSPHWTDNFFAQGDLHVGCDLELIWILQNPIPMKLLVGRLHRTAMNLLRFSCCVHRYLYIHHDGSFFSHITPRARSRPLAFHRCQTVMATLWWLPTNEVVLKATWGVKDNPLGPSKTWKVWGTKVLRNETNKCIYIYSIEYIQKNMMENYGTLTFIF